MQLQGYQKKTMPELLRAVDECQSVVQLFSLIRQEGIVIQMKSQNAASNIPMKPLVKNPGILPLDSLKKQVREEVLRNERRHTKEQLIRAVKTCPTIDKLFELVKKEHIVIRMKSQHSASCLPQHRIQDEELIPDSSPLDRLKEQVLEAVMYGS